MEQGLIHIYCGDGKGKTTAAVGLAVRAAGCGKKILIARFLKNERSGELNSLKKLSDIEILYPGKSFGFFKNLPEEEKKECTAVYRSLWETAARRCMAKEFDIVILDEVMAACRYEIVDSYAVAEFLRKKPKHLEVILTGREPSGELLELADYVSEIRKVKHPFDRGIMAREGIEY